MKRSSQRDILIAYWLLFDELSLGDGEPAPAAADVQPPPDDAKPKADPKSS